MTKRKKWSPDSKKHKLYYGRMDTPPDFTKVEFSLNGGNVEHGPYYVKGPHFEKLDKYADESVEEAKVEHVFHLIPGPLRGKFMDELYRVLIVGGKIAISTPYWSHMRAVQDFMHAWPPVCEASFLYFNKEWRKLNRIDYPMVCDYDYAFGYSVDQETANRNEETRAFWIKHYGNTATDLQVTLTKRQPAKPTL